MDPAPLAARARPPRVGARDSPSRSARPGSTPRAAATLPLRADVQRLLDANARAGGQLESPADATAAFDDERDQPGLSHGDRVGIYVIDQELARGGMGVVYRAWDTRLERWVALKALSPALPADLQARDRLHREARAAGKLSHEAIATIYALEEVDDDLFIVSEFVAGQTLRARLSEGRLPVRESVEIMLGVARGLAAAHELGIVHRDLKPENVMLTTGGRVKVVDFGIASVGGTSGLTRTGIILGTPGYMSPEQISGQPADARSDVFSLGVLLYEMVGGRPPFGDTASWTVVSAVLERDPQPLGQFVDGRACGARARRDDVPGQGARRTLSRRQRHRLRARACAGRTGDAGRPAAPAATHAAAVEPTDVASARWWLQFHQLAASVALALLMIPAWKLMSRLPRLPGRLLVMALLILAAGIGTMRLHLWFTARHDGAGLAGEVSRVAPLLRWSNRAVRAAAGPWRRRRRRPVAGACRGLPGLRRRQPRRRRSHRAGHHRARDSARAARLRTRRAPSPKNPKHPS